MPARTTRADVLLRAALLALSLLAALVVWPAGPAAAAPADEVTWGVRTAADDQGADRRNFGYEIDPGQALRDAIVVTNHGDAPIELDLYAADAYTNENGQLDLVTRDEESTTVGAWVQLDTDHVQLPPDGSVEVPFTVTVPENATPGDHAGGIVTSLSTPVEENGITVDRRLGIRVALRVGGELTPRLTVEDLRVDAAGTANPFGTVGATVHYTVRNTGNARLSAGQAVSLAGPFGMLRADAAVDPVPVLLPGETWEVTVPVGGVAPSVRVTAEVVLQPALVDESGTGGPVLPTVEASAATWAVPWTLLVLVVLLVAAAVLAVRRRRRRGRREAARVAEAVAQALREKEEARPVG
jgi:hypothetical protein